MSPRARMITLALIAGFVAYLLWSTLASQQVECSVTVEFRGERRTATASAASEDAAAEQAQTAACGPMARGMNESIACSRVAPLSRRCRAL